VELIKVGTGLWPVPSLDRPEAYCFEGLGDGVHMDKKVENTELSADFQSDIPMSLWGLLTSFGRCFPRYSLPCIDLQRPSKQ